jgi:hypothetical protein
MFVEVTHNLIFTGVQEIVATSNISRGGEITLCYLSAAGVGSGLREERQAYVREFYGFQCACETCTLHDEALTKNEVIRSRVRVVQESAGGGDDADYSLLNLFELSAFFDDLCHIGAKFTYQLDIARTLLDRAVAEGDRYLAAKTAVAGYMLHDVMRGGNEINEFQFAIGSILVFEEEDEEEGFLFFE